MSAVLVFYTTPSLHISADTNFDRFYHLSYSGTYHNFGNNMHVRVNYTHSTISVWKKKLFCLPQAIDPLSNEMLCMKKKATAENK